MFRDEAGRVLFNRLLDSSALFRDSVPVSEPIDVVGDGQGWKALGRAVRRAREQRPEYVDTPSWADAVGRSARQVLGLERGEHVGPKTLRAVEAALDWPEGRATDILHGYNVWVGPTGEVQEIRPVTTRVYREGTLIGEIYEDNDPGEIIGEGGWVEFSDERLGQLVEEVGAELRRRASTRAALEIERPNAAYDLAADRQAAVPEGVRRRAAQDAAGEEPQVGP